MSMESYNSSEEREEAMLQKESRPRNTGELQAELIAEHFLSNHPELTEEEFLHSPQKNEMEMSAFKEWNESGLRQKFRMMAEELGDRKMLETTLDSLNFYSGKDIQ